MPPSSRRTGVAQVEHPAVGADEPVASAAGAGHADEGPVQGTAAGRSGAKTTVTGVKVMVTLKPLSGKLSVMSVAVKVTLSDVSSVTVKLAGPSNRCWPLREKRQR